MTFPNPGPASQSTGNVAGGPYVAWSGTNTTAQIGPAGVLVPLGAGAGGGVALYDGANSITSGTAQFSNANGVTFGFNGQTVTASVVTSYTQTNQTVASGAIAGTGFTTTTTGGTVVVGTNNTAGLSLGIPAYLTTAAAAATGISSIADSAHTQTVGMLSFANSNGITFGISTGALTATITASAATAAPGISGIADSAGTQTVGTLSFANSNGITFGLSTGANTATLTASFNASQYFFSNSNNISFGSNGSTVTASFSQSVQTQASGNIGATGFATTTTNGLVIVGTNNTTGFTLAVPPYITTYAAGAAGTVSYYENQPHMNLTYAAASASIGPGVFYLQPFRLDAPLTMYRGMVIDSISTAVSSISAICAISQSQGSTAATLTEGQSFTFAMLSRVSTGTNVNSSNIVTFASTTMSRTYGLSVTYSCATAISTGSATLSSSFGVGFIKNIDSAGAITSTTAGSGGSTSTSLTTNAASTFTYAGQLTAPQVFMTGPRPINIPLAASFSPGEYWFGIQVSTSSGNTNIVSGAANLAVFVPNLGVWTMQGPIYPYGLSNATSNSTYVQQGIGTVSSAGTGGAFALSTVTGNTVGANTYFALMAQTL